MNDLIRRQAVVNTVFSMLCKWDTEDPDDLKNMLLLAFQELPAAQPYVPDTNVGDIISRQAAIEVADAVWCVTGDKNVAKVWDQIRGLPAADAVPVIRCKDCKYSYIFEPWEDAVRYCNRLRLACAKDSDMPVYDDDFCSQGERREK